MIFKGTVKIGEIYHGGTLIGKVFKGKTKVWDVNPYEKGEVVSYQSPGKYEGTLSVGVWTVSLCGSGGSGLGWALEGYSDMSDLKLFEDYTTRLAAEKERVNGRFETIFSELVASRERLQAEVCRLDKEAALNKQATDFGFISVNQEFARINNRLNDITKEVIPLSVICPQPLAGCVPVGFQGQVVNTTATGETNTVIMANKAAKQQ